MLVLLPALAACSAPAQPEAAPVVEVGLAGAPVPVRPEPVELPDPDPADAVVGADPADAQLPPGDPGPDAPAVPEPAETQVDEPAGPRRVPVEALLTAPDLGPGWRAAPIPRAACAPRLRGPSATGALASDDGSTLVETVRVAADGEAAVADWRRALSACGYALAPLALGEEGLSAVGPGERVLVTTAEQVVVVLRAGGPLADDPALPDRADLALGTSCPAAPDGCH